MGRVVLQFKTLITILYFYFAYHNCECSDAEIENFNLNSKQITIIQDVGISSDHQFGTLNATVICDDKNRCKNGGSCYNNVCICLPGTSGELCGTIDGCSDLKCDNDKNAVCNYDQRNFKAICNCKEWRHVFDYDEKVCKDCECDDCTRTEKGCRNTRKCEFIRSEKACTCALPNYQFNPKTKLCEMCNCGPNSEACYFDNGGNQKCRCAYRYQPRNNYCERCECYGSATLDCMFVNYEKVCTCYTGYVYDNGNCKKCTCGDKGKCIFEYSEQKGCICNPGYMEISGVCKEISDCYCGENSNCTFNKEKQKVCSCQEGFMDISGLCTDINECDNPKACPSNSICLNSIGSFSCKCRDGFIQSKLTGKCEDIDECLNASSCTGSDTECFNTVGSFRCVCKPGFATRDGISVNPVCESKSSWKLGFGLLIGIFLAVIIGLIIAIYRKS